MLMKAIDKVKAIYPDAVIRQDRDSKGQPRKWFHVLMHTNGRKVIGRGKRTDWAWADAARYIEKTRNSHKG